MKAFTLAIRCNLFVIIWRFTVINGWKLKICYCLKTQDFTLNRNSHSVFTFRVQAELHGFETIAAKQRLSCKMTKWAHFDGGNPTSWVESTIAKIADDIGLLTHTDSNELQHFASNFLQLFGPLHNSLQSNVKIIQFSHRTTTYFSQFQEGCCLIYTLAIK